jgi:hypothetical protein
MDLRNNRNEVAQNGGVLAGPEKEFEHIIPKSDGNLQLPLIVLSQVISPTFLCF